MIIFLSIFLNTGHSSKISHSNIFAEVGFFNKSSVSSDAANTNRLWADAEKSWFTDEKLNVNANHSSPALDDERTKFQSMQ